LRCAGPSAVDARARGPGRGGQVRKSRPPALAVARGGVGAGASCAAVPGRLLPTGARPRGAGALRRGEPARRPVHRPPPCPPCPPAASWPTWSPEGWTVCSGRSGTPTGSERRPSCATSLAWREGPGTVGFVTVTKLSLLAVDPDLASARALSEAFTRADFGFRA